MFKGIKIHTLVFLVIFISIFVPLISHGNSAEPPSILIIVPNAPNDLEIGVEDEGTYTKARKIDKTFEKHYTFYVRELPKTSEYKFAISGSDIYFEISLDKPRQSYSNIYTLNLESQTLTLGKSLSRSIFLVSLRIIFTLIIEGLVFWLFGFRSKGSWMAFLIINLITQGLLNIWINSFSPIIGYLFIALIFAEIIIVISETIAFAMFTKERSKATTIAYVFVANILSFIVGGYIISILSI